MSSFSSAKSKRNSKSISSDPSSSRDDGRRSNKKKKTPQGTIGMAWGANSQSGSRSSFRNSPFSDFGSYMAVKNQKLREQFDAAASSSSHSESSSAKPVFFGVSIFVDGYTVPSSQELKGYMLKYGGRFENYFSRHRVTHIICSNLPDSKIKNMRAFSGGLPVVKPEWVVESVACNKLLSWVPYQLDKLATECENQPKLFAFFTREKDVASESTNSLVDLKVLGGDPLVAKEILHQSGNSASLGQTDIRNVEVSNHMKGIIDETRAIESACSVESSYERKVVEPSDCSPVNGMYFDSKCKPATSQPSSLVCNDGLDGYSTLEASSSKVIVPSSRCFSTFSNPNFVENYFKSSRLHFIGTWRNRYRKRFPGSSVSRSSCQGMTSSKIRTTIIHIDMDCFFVSVVIRNRPELLGKPVAVCHSDNPRGTAEISSANYPAREYGLKAGMFVRDAKIQCPNLVIVPYDFGAYEKVADQFYDILHKHCNKVQAVSCDEAFLDICDSEITDPRLVASKIRAEILETTGCTASAGIAGNMLMARLATRSAKPDGQCYIPYEKVDNYLSPLPVKALPGIGRSLEEKLDKKNINTCGQLRLLTKESLQCDFGNKIGEMLWNYSRGIDNRTVGFIQENKSVGADVNWGVRFRNTDDVHHFLKSLCKEVALRLQGCGVMGRSFTLKVKKRRNEAGEPVKYMGCGDCENLSHTITIPMPTDDVDTLLRLTTPLFGHFHLDPQDIRGVGLHVSKLEAIEHGKMSQKKNSIRPWLFSMSARTTGQNKINVISNNRSSICANTPSVEKSSGETSALFSGSEASAALPLDLPPLDDLDLAVIESLPEEIVSEINNMYDGKLSQLIFKNTSKGASSALNVISPTCSSGKHVGDNEAASLAVSKNTSVSPNYMMPLSMSQVDCSVLRELPVELQKDIIELLPPHRGPDLINDPSSEAVVEITGLASSGINGLWVGTPPKWVEMFETNKCAIVNSFAKIYKSDCSGYLSSLLEQMICGSLSIDFTSDGSNDSFSLICELFKQYADLKVETDIEEMYSCACILKRLQARSKFFSQVYDSILPYVQALVAEKYGGTLNFTCK